MAPLRSTDLDRLPRLEYPGRDQVGSLVSPLLRPVVTKWASNTVQRLLGFWVLWHSYGGQKPLAESGFMPERTIRRNRAEFKRVFHTDVTEFGPDAAAGIRLLLAASAPASEPQPAPEHAAS